MRKETKERSLMTPSERLREIMPRQKWKRIKLTKGKYAIVDNDVFETFNKYKWHTHYQAKWRAYARIHATIAPKVRKSLYMHQAVIGRPLKKGMVIDHINGNGLDNRRENLRFVTARQNAENRIDSRGKTGFVGVQKRTRKQGYSYLTGLRFNGKYVYIGTYPTGEEASLARQKFLQSLLSPKESAIKKELKP